MLNYLRKNVKNIHAFFPVKLILLNFKKNQVLLIFWLILFAVVRGKFGAAMGIPFLLLEPEYMGEVGSLKSMMIIGVAFGIFTISYFITSYILDSHRFKFLSTVKLPFIHYSFNNSFFPLSFVFVYICSFIEFTSLKMHHADYGWACLELLVFVLAFLLTLLLFFTYFGKTNKDSVLALVQNIDKKLKKKRINAISVLTKVKQSKEKKYEIDSYLGLNFKLKRVEDHLHYDRSMFAKIIDQHHLNAVIVEVAVLVLLFIIGQFRDYDWFQIPAGASSMLFFSILIMFTGAFSYWLKGWAISTLILSLIVVNFLVKYDYLKSSYQAFGLDYSLPSIPYNEEVVHSYLDTSILYEDRAQMVKILENWQKKNTTEEYLKPKMVFVCASGGGQRAAYWALNSLQQIDKASQGLFFKRTQLITGASGGMIGSAYYRELKLRQCYTSLDCASSVYLDNMGKDLLNPMIFSLVVSDMFMRSQKFDFKGFEYYKGRGHAFEQRFNKNTDNIMNKTVSQYRSPEFQSLIPMMVFSPTIINDGRKLHISSQGVSFMMGGVSGNEQEVQAIEFSRYFKDFGPDNLSFLTALRMSATFPYVTPTINLPSSPEMEIMDAGMSDNFGITDAVNFIHVFDDWIEKNTSGVVLVSIRDSERELKFGIEPRNSLWDKVLNPIGSLFSNWGNIQDFNNEKLILFIQSELNFNVDYVGFEYVPKTIENNPSSIEEINQKRASLSWHLTKNEKKDIKESFFTDKNQKSLDKLLKLLKE